MSGFLIGASWPEVQASKIYVILRPHSRAGSLPHRFCIHRTNVGASLLANGVTTISLINDDPSKPHPHDCPRPCGSAPAHRES
ncbi:hypothetical protein FE275_05140 [Pseudomonas koreensis]|nr:hypothetical protein FE275_05140 [Pseudomonas koreensis]